MAQGEEVLGWVLQEQAVLDFAVSRKLIKSSPLLPFTADEATGRGRTRSVIKPLKRVAVKCAWFQWTFSQHGLVITREIRWHQEIGDFFLWKWQPVGSPVCASSASSGGILERNVQRRCQWCPQLVKIYILVREWKYTNNYLIFLRILPFPPHFLNWMFFKQEIIKAG